MRHPPHPDTQDRPIFGAAAGAVGVLLFITGAVVTGDRPAFDAPAAELAAHLGEQHTRIQIGCALFAAATPFLVWFLATVASLAGPAGPAAWRTGVVALGCGLVFVAVFLADVTSLAVAALRPENMTAHPELPVALRDFELLAMGTAAFPVAAMLAACAVLALRHKAVWPDWVGALAAVAAVLYLLRAGTLFTDSGPFAADGVLGISVPVGALAAWLATAGVTLALRGPR